MPGSLFLNTIKIGSAEFSVRARSLAYAGDSHRIKRIKGGEYAIDVAVTYRGGLDRDKDRAIRSAMGGRTDGSGFYFRSRIRDIHKTFKVPNKARLAIAELRKISGIKILIWKIDPPQQHFHLSIGPRGSRVVTGRRRG